MVMWPDSSGSRKASSAARGNSGSSSRNSTPLCASEISPGLGGEPPPTSATALAEWCGAQVGRKPHWASEKRPARLAMAALCSASGALMGGSRPAKRCASMDLPVPGGPDMSRLWPPAAAISSARLAAAWPFTSARSGYWGAAAGVAPASLAQPLAASEAGGGAPSGRNCATTSSKWRARYTSMPGASAASSALPGGSTRRTRAASFVCAACRAAAVASAPRTGRSSPESDSSPANSQPASLRPSIWPLAARMPSAMGRSKRPESLGKSAGARLTVMRWLCGNCRPLLSKALRTRSRASFTSTSARPTSVNAGRPLARCASTATAGAASPIRARPCTRLNPMLGSLPFFAGLFDYENNSCPGLFHGRKRLKRPPETQH